MLLFASGQVFRDPFTYTALGDKLMQLPMEWWIVSADRRPLGPITTELLLEGIGAGRVPTDVLVCEVGGTRWKSIGDVAVFAAALSQPKPRFSGDGEIDAWASRRNECGASARDGLGTFDDTLERTIIESSPLLGSEPPIALLHDFDDGDEKTIVDRVPLRPSEPP
jgi:hypothetical protein